MHPYPIQKCPCADRIPRTRPHPDANFIIDTAEASTVTLVGQVQSVTPQHTNITYKIDDGTGLIEVKQWIDSDAAESENPATKKVQPQEGQYIRVAGKLKDFNGKRHVGAHMIRVVEDYNEVNYHLLESAVVHLYFTRGPPNAGGDATKQENGNGGMFVEGGHGDGMQSKKTLPRLTANTRKVYNLLESAPQSNEGLHVSDIAQRVGLPQSEVFKAGDELLAEGLIFTTVDDETWAILEY